MELAWQRHEIKILDKELNIENHIPISTNGLDTNAQRLHRDFITNLPHLSEVRDGHMAIVEDIGSDIEAGMINNRSILSTEDLLSELNGEMDGKGISLPIKITSSDNIIIQSRMENENQIVQIISAEINGGIFRSFIMPNGCEISSISSGNGIIEILFL
jgi:hypothetical protein|tara:strand:- start:183 stop:659 length:477 start_codon:yes stop_codon:yes gene_type:complete